MNIAMRCVKNSATESLSWKCGPEAQSPSTQALRVLLVDDNSAILKMMANMMTILGFETDTAPGGLEGQQKLLANHYDLALVDLEMPGLNGYRLSVWLRSHAPRTKIIIMTGCCRAEVQELMLAGVVDEWLFKPFGMRELRQKLAALEIGPAAALMQKSV